MRCQTQARYSNAGPPSSFFLQELERQRQQEEEVARRERMRRRQQTTALHATRSLRGEELDEDTRDPPAEGGIKNLEAQDLEHFVRYTGFFQHFGGDRDGNRDFPDPGFS